MEGSGRSEREAGRNEGKWQLIYSSIKNNEVLKNEKVILNHKYKWKAKLA